MPVRKIPKNYRNVTGIAAQSKAIGEARFESRLERDFIALLEFSPEVARYEVQPVKIEWKDAQGKPRYYRPDVRVEFCDELKRPPCLYEVKCREDLRTHWDELHPKFRQGKPALLRLLGEEAAVTFTRFAEGDEVAAGLLVVLSGGDGDLAAPASKESTRVAKRRGLLRSKGRDPL